MNNKKDSKISEENANTPELDDFADLYQQTEITVDRALFKFFTKDVNVMKIIRLLHNSKSDCYGAEIAKSTGMTKRSAYRWLKRLTSAGILEVFFPENVNRLIKYYRIPNTEFSAKMIKRYYWKCSSSLANCISFNGTYIEDLRKNIEFYRLCQRYALSFEEGVESLKLSKEKICCVYSDRVGDRGKLLYFKRLSTSAESWSLPEEK